MQFLYILPVFVRFAIILLLAGVSFAFSAESADSVSDIPLPKQSAYTGKGFTVGIGMGVSGYVFSRQLLSYKPKTRS